MLGRVLGFVLLLIVLAAIAAAVWFWSDYSRFRDAPLALRSNEQIVEVAKGESFRDIVRDIRAADLSRAPPLYWRVLAEQLGVAGKLHAGEYALPRGISARALLGNMAQGKVLQRRITLVEGWTFQQVRAALAAAPKLTHEAAQLRSEERRVGK